MRADATKEAAQTRADATVAAAQGKTDAVKKTLTEAADAFAKGDIATYQTKLKEANELSSATKVPGKDTELSLIAKAQGGDKEAQKQLDTLQDRRKELIAERNKGYMNRPLFQLQKVLDPATGQSSFMTGLSILEAQKEGKNYIPAGALSQKDIIGVQQLQNEAAPAIKGVNANIGAFDNTKDRAIFARILANAGVPTRGEEAGWITNIINQAAKENLSPEGQKLAQNISRLAETMGRLRSTLGMPATDQSMAITMSLLPGGSTPNSKYAKEQVGILEDMIKKAVSIPAYGGGTVRMQTSDGKIWEIAPDKVPAAQKRGAKIVGQQ